MQLLSHPNVVQLKHSFYFTAKKNEGYLNLVLEYVSETIYRASRHYSRVNQYMPVFYMQLYVYQICRALKYLDIVIEVCHPDIKPHNLLFNKDKYSQEEIDEVRTKWVNCVLDYI